MAPLNFNGSIKGMVFVLIFFLIRPILAPVFYCVNNLIMSLCYRGIEFSYGYLCPSLLLSEVTVLTTLLLNGWIWVVSYLKRVSDKK